MMRVGTFNSEEWGQVEVFKGNYAEGQLAIMLMNEGEPLATLSVNIYKPSCSHDSKDLPSDCFYMKDWSENESLAMEAAESGLFKRRPDLPSALSGFVMADAWQLIA